MGKALCTEALVLLGKVAKVFAWKGAPNVTQPILFTAVWQDKRLQQETRSDCYSEFTSS